MAEAKAINSVGIAIVTGANKGIGLQVVKEICKKFNGTVILTSRNLERGKAAIADCKKAGFNPILEQLELTDSDSVAAFAETIKSKYGGINILVNNAGFAFKNAATEPFAEQAEVTIAVNYYGTRAVCEALFPLLRPNARVVNVSSSAGHLGRVIKSEELKQRFLAPDLTHDDVATLMEEFKVAAKDGTHREKGWPNSTYCVSKVGVSAMSRIQQREFDVEGQGKVVNHVHPGYVNTDMTSGKGSLTVEQGARAITMCSFLPENTDMKGAYVWYDCSVKDWTRA